MSKLLRNLLAFGVVMAAFIAVVHVQPTWAATLTLDLWNIVELEQTIESQVRKRQVLDEQFELALQRCRRRRQLADHRPLGWPSSGKFRECDPRLLPAGRSVDYR